MKRTEERKKTKTLFLFNNKTPAVNGRNDKDIVIFSGFNSVTLSVLKFASYKNELN